MIRSLNQKKSATAEQILNLSLQAYRIESDLIGGFDIPPLHETLDEIQTSKSRFYGCYREALLAGVIELDGEAEVTINRLVVNPQFFKQGVATELLDYAKRTAGRLSVSTASGNLPAVNLYLKSGFYLVSTRDVPPGLTLSTFEYKAALDPQHSP